MPSAPGWAPGTSYAGFYAELPVQITSDFLGAFGIDVAASSTRIEIGWVGQLSYAAGFAAGYAGLEFPGSPDDAVRIRGNGPIPSADSVGVSPVARVAGLPDGEFAFAWQDPAGAILVSVLTAFETWRGPWEVVPAPTSEGALDLSSNGQDLLLAWVTSTAANATLRVTRFSSVDGAHIGEVIVDDHSTAAKLAPRLVTRDGAVHAAWRRTAGNESAVFYASGPVPGPWSSPLAVTRDLTAPYEHNPRIVVAANDTVLVLLDDLAANRDGAGFLRVLGSFKLATRGLFGPAFDFGARVGAIQEWPLIEVALDSTDALHLAWLDGEPGSGVGWTRVMYASSLSGWSVFSSPLQIDADPTTFSKDNPAIAVGPNDRLYVVWGDRRDSTGIPKPFLVRSILAPQTSMPAFSPLVTGLGFAGVGAGIGAGAYLVAAKLSSVRRRRM